MSGEDGQLERGQADQQDGVPPLLLVVTVTSLTGATAFLTASYISCWGRRLHRTRTRGHD